MLVSFVGFIGAASWDLFFKIAIDVIAGALLIKLGMRISRELQSATAR
jgi:hypothetical protein